MSFDFGEYSAAHDDEEMQTLSWRDDPERSLSDWTIVVKKGDGSTDDTYHVHKAMLGAGAQQSDYFKSVFRGGASGMRESSSHTTSLTLEQSAAEAMPTYLDFAYTGELAASTATATALLHLASYLRCRTLHSAAAVFMQDDLSGDTAALYLAEAELYSLDKVAAAALPLCAESLPSAPDSVAESYVLALPPPLFLRVVQSPSRKCTSTQLSELVAKYFRGPNSAAVDGALLASLTAVDAMPEVAPIVSLALLELAVSLRPDNEQSLKERAVDASSRHWQQALLPAIMQAEAPPPQQAVDETTQRPKRRRGAAGGSAAAPAPPEMPSPLGGTIPESDKVRLLAKALQAAAAEIESNKVQAAQTEKQLQEQLRQTEQQRSHAQSQHAQATRELARFKRIPKDAYAGIVNDSQRFQVTYSASADMVPCHTIYDRSRQRMYGQTTPVSLPSGGALDREGFLFPKTTRDRLGREQFKVCAAYYFE